MRQENLSDGPGQRRGSAARSCARPRRGGRQRDGEAGAALSRYHPPGEAAVRGAGLRLSGVGRICDDRGGGRGRCAGDRKSVVWGKGVSVRVDLGGGRIVKKKKKIKR